MSYPTQTDNGYKLSINQNPNYFTERSWLINTREDVLKYPKTNMNEQWKRAYQNLADALNVLDAMIARCEAITCQKEEINNDLAKYNSRMPSEEYLKKQRDNMEDFIWNRMNKTNQNK